MHWLTGQWAQTGQVAGKAALMYATALIGLRIGERRTLAQWTIIDFAVAVAMGAIIGRTAVAGSQSYVTGAVAVVTLLVFHRVISMLRLTGLVAKLVDHRVRVLVVDGRVRRGELRKCAITEDDLFSQLRQAGVYDLEEIHFVLYETKGNLTIVPRDAAGNGTEPPLVEAGVRSSTSFRKAV